MPAETPNGTLHKQRLSKEPRPSPAWIAVSTNARSPLGLFEQVGRYFSAVSLTSSVTLVGAVTLIVSSGAVGGSPNLSNVATAVRGLDVRQTALLTLAALVMGLALHPLQYGLVQLLEGYWGISSIAVGVAASLRHRAFDRVIHLDNLQIVSDAELHSLTAAWTEALDDRERAMPFDQRAYERHRLRLITASEEAARLRDKYPPDRDRLMPTALGNRLRRGEDLAGAAFNIDSITAAPHLMLLADAAVQHYHDDTTTEYDTAARYCLVWTLIAGFAALAFWDNGWWLLTSVACYGLAWLSYRGAVSAAEEHGAALGALVALTRFRLYKAMGVRQPVDSFDERAVNSAVSAALRGDVGVNLKYSSTPAAADHP